VNFVGVCGGRNFSNSKLLEAVLESNTSPSDVIVHGACDGGADRMADAWAEEHVRHVVRIPAQWKQRGRGAGPERNGVIAALPLRLLIAFPGGAGTADMVRRAKLEGIEVLDLRGESKL
jgi:hypothetical protein